MKQETLRVVVTDFEMSFGNMVIFMLKWTLAAIPALAAIGIVAYIGLQVLKFALTWISVFAS